MGTLKFAPLAGAACLTDEVGGIHSRRNKNDPVTLRRAGRGLLQRAETRNAQGRFAVRLVSRLVAGEASRRDRGLRRSPVAACGPRDGRPRPVGGTGARGRSLRPRAPAHCGPEGVGGRIAVAAPWRNGTSGQTGSSPASSATNGRSGAGVFARRAVRRRMVRQRLVVSEPIGRCASGPATATTFRSASPRAATSCNATKMPAAHSVRARTSLSTSRGIPAMKAARWCRSPGSLMRRSQPRSVIAASMTEPAPAGRSMQTPRRHSRPSPCRLRTADWRFRAQGRAGRSSRLRRCEDGRTIPTRCESRRGLRRAAGGPRARWHDRVSRGT